MKKCTLLFINFIFLLTTNLFSQNNDNLFITDEEYGKMLYTNPRGIGCIKCHGKKGEKEFIAKYKNKLGIQKLFAPKINDKSLEKFTYVLTTKRSSRSIMPTYFLTKDEIKSIYLYIAQNK